MARVLLEKETIHTTEVEMLIAGESAQTVINFIDKKYNPEKPQVATPAPAVEQPKAEQVIAPDEVVEDVAQPQVEEKAEQNSDDNQ